MKIGILGDSISMTIGLREETYPFILAKIGDWPLNTEFVNFSQPGNMAPDNYVNLKRYLRHSTLDQVIICLGTCDSISTEHVKGRGVEWWGSLVSRRKRKLFNNTPKFFEWSTVYDPTLETVELIEDFSWNIERIIKLCQRNKIRVLLVIPSSNFGFQSGLAKGNFIFYDINKLLLGAEVKSPDGCPTFAKALSFHIEGRFGDAKKAYSDIFGTSDELKRLGVDGVSVVINNYAMCCFRSGEYLEAELLLRLLSKERKGRRDIAICNLGAVQDVMGKAQGEKLSEARVREEDTGNYRIRPSFVNKLHEIGEKYSSENADFQVLDCSEFLSANHFFDHCHPDAAAHEEVARRILGIFQIEENLQSPSAVIRNNLSNPEVSFGVKDTFCAYYRIEATFSAEEIRSGIVDLKCKFQECDYSELETSLNLVERISRDALEKDSARVVRGLLRHPMYINIDAILRDEPDATIDGGRFSDFFFFRRLLPYIKTYEKNQELQKSLRPIADLIASSDSIESMFRAVQVDLGKRVVEEARPDGAQYSIVRAQVLSKVSHTLLKILQAGDVTRLREKTTMYWFFRETIRFGSQSRSSMRFDLTAMEYSAEALLRVAVTDLIILHKSCKMLEGLIDVLSGIHNTFVFLTENSTQRSISHEIREEFLIRLDGHESKLNYLADGASRSRGSKK